MMRSLLPQRTRKWNFSSWIFLRVLCVLGGSSVRFIEPPRTQRTQRKCKEGFGFLLGFLCVLCGSSVFAADQRETTTGMEAAIEGLILPGTELEVAPIEDRRNPLIVRIVEVSPHGTAFRYHLSYYALEPGTYDL